MTPSETRQVRRAHREWTHFAIHMAIIITLGVLILVNQYDIMIMQTDTLNTLNDMRIEESIDRPRENHSHVNSALLTHEERELIERVTAAEARGEDLQGMMAVAQTILDRSELWNMTPTEVVQAPGQYADPYQGKISDEIRLAVANVFDGGVRVFEDPVTHFYSGDDPHWIDDKVNRGNIGCHKFYY